MTQMRVSPSTTEDTINDIASQLHAALADAGTIGSYLIIANAFKFEDTGLRATGATICSEGLNSQQRIQMLEKALEHERSMLADA
jgi:hypothetical protein